MRNPITIRIAILTTILLALFAPLAQAQYRAQDGFVRAHAIAFQMDANRVIQPLSHAFRERELEPKTEEELLAVLEQERTNPPVMKGHLAIRAQDAGGRVIYRTIESVVLQKRIHTDHGETLKEIEKPVFMTVVPAGAVTMTIECWLPASRATFYLSELADEYGERNASGRLSTQADPPPTTVAMARNRFNILILGDGYLEADKQLFESDAAAVSSTMMSTHPYDRYAALISISSWFDASEHRGAKHPTCSESATIKECDPAEAAPANWANHRTVFGASYCDGNVQRGLEVDDGKVTAKVNAVVTGGRPDVVVVLVNDSVWGGSGGTYATSNSRQPNHAPHGIDRMSPYLPYVVMHEVAHLLGLSDEYDGPIIGPQNICNGPCGPNVMGEATAPALSTIKWARWIDVPTTTSPVPTCTGAQHPLCSNLTGSPKPVGLYEGAGGAAQKAWRPELECIMRASAPGAGKETCPTTGPATHRRDAVTTTGHYCRVCADHIIRALYDEVDPIDRIYEENHTNQLRALIRPGTTILLGGDVLRLPTSTNVAENQVIRWKENGQDKPEHNGKTSVPYTGISGTRTNMEMIISDPTSFVRDHAAHGLGTLAKPRNMSARSVKWYMWTPSFLKAATNQTSEVIQTEEITVPQGAAGVTLKYAVNSQEPGDPNRPGDFWSIIVAPGGTQATATTASAPLFTDQKTIKSSSENFERLVEVPVDTTQGPARVRVTVRIRNLEPADFVDSEISAEFSAGEITGCDAECEICTIAPTTPGCPLVFRALKAEMLPLEPNAANRGDNSFVSIARTNSPSGLGRLDRGRHVRIETTAVNPAMKRMEISVFVMSPLSEELALIRRTTWNNDGSRPGGSTGMERVTGDGKVWKLNVSQKEDFGNDSLLASIPDDKWPFAFKYRIRLVMYDNQGRSATTEFDVNSITAPESPAAVNLHALRAEEVGEGIWHRYATIHAHRWYTQNAAILHRADRMSDEHAAYDTPVGHERGTAFTEVSFYPGAGVWTNSSTAPQAAYFNFRKTVSDFAGFPAALLRGPIVTWINQTREHLNTLVPAQGVQAVRLGDGSTGCDGARINDNLPDGWMRELLEYGRVTRPGVATPIVDVTADVGTAHWQPTQGSRIFWGCAHNYFIDVELDRCRIGELPGPCNSGRPPGLRRTFIRTQPTGSSITSGQTATLTVDADGEELRYRWYSGPAANFTESRPVPNGETPTLRVSPPETQRYWVYVWGGNGSATSDNALVQVAGTGTTPCKPPTITQQPKLITYLDPETSTTLSVTATGTNLTYQWYYAATVDAPFTLIPGAFEREYQLASAAGRYHVRVQNSCGTVFSNSAFLVMNTSCAVPTITSKTLDRRVTLGDFLDLNVTATGKAPLSYSWTERTPEGATRYLGATATLRVYPAIDGIQYIPTVGNECKFTTGDPVTIEVCFPPQVSEHPQSKNIVRGESVTLTVAATGSTPLTITWIDGDSKTVGTGTSVTVAPTTTTTYYARVSSSCGQVTSFGALVTVCHPPTITTPPQGANLTLGDSKTLTVVAGGTGPHTYQWFANGTAVNGATASSMDVTPSATTTYHVVVTGACGNVTSSTATINVCAPPQITAHPQGDSIEAGEQVTLAVTATGTAPLSYTLLDQNNNQIATGSSHSFTFVPSIPAGGTGRYRIRVSGNCGTPVLSNEATITVAAATCELPVINVHPQPDTIQSGETAHLSVSATGATGYQWYANGTAISGATSSAYDASPASTTTYHVVVSNSCGSFPSNPATVTVGACAAPSVAEPPQSISITTGQAHTLRVTLNGTAPYHYQWYANGAAVSGATGSSYTVTPAATTSYYVVVSNACGTVTSPTATVSINCAIPVINFHPQSDAIEPGQTVELNVGASGLQPFSYQWYANGSPVGSNISSSLTVSPASTTNYYVVVSNACGSSTSNTATITVSSCLPATFTKRANNVTIAPGETTTLSVQASGTAPISYVWRDANNNIVGTGPSINVAPAESTSYSVRISNGCGTDTDPVIVTVVECPPPVITIHPKSFSMTEGGSAFYEVVATSSTPLSYQWYANGVAMPGKTSRAMQIEPSVTTTYVVDVTNSCGTVRSNPGTVTVIPCTKPQFTTQPKNMTIVDGEAAVISAAASGTGPITYTLIDQDRNFIDSNTSGAFSVRPPVLAPYVWGYWITASNACGTIFSEGVAVTVLAACTPPSISGQPQNATIAQGDNASLSITASGSSPLDIRWFTSGGQQVGSGNSISVSPSSTTSYYATVSNNCGERQSVTVTVTVTQPCTPPSITAPLNNQSSLLGYGLSKTLTVTATGDNLQYQWYERVPAGAGSFVLMTGKTSASLVVSPEEDTNYRVRVFNSCGDITSPIWTIIMWDGPPGPLEP